MIKQDKAIQKRIDMDLLRRSKTGIVVYALMLPVVFWPFEFHLMQPDLSIVFALSMFAISTLRAIHWYFTRQLYSYSANLWRRLFECLSLSHAGVLSVFFALSIYDQRFDTLINVTMLAIGGICSGAVVALIPRMKLALTNLCVLLAPSIIAGIVIEDKLPFAMMILVFMGFIALMGIRAGKEYTRAFEVELMLDEQKKQLEKQNSIDALTSIYNRGYFNQELEKQWDYASRLNLKLSLLLVDVDHFKTFNDNYGHLLGDACLVHVADIINQTSKRKTDLAARFGGEEFVLLLVEKEPQDAVDIAEQLRKSIEAQPFVSEGKSYPVTASIGVSSIQPDHKMDPRQLIEQADLALYKAKNQGRNKVVVHQNP
ncbi:GGDEF domain-containing protein [Paraglaciecola aestuariivivens]